MQTLAIRVAVLAVSFLVLDGIMDSVSVSGGVLGHLGLAVVYGLVSAVIGTLLRLLTLPLVLLTAGLFEIVINGAMLSLTEALTDWIELDRFLTAVGAAIVLSIVSTVLGFVLAIVFPDTRRR